MAELVLYALVAGVLGGAVASGVVWALFGRWGRVDADVEELASHVEKLGRQWRTVQMRAVRAAAEDRPTGNHGDVTPPPELAQAIPQAQDLSKEQLRAFAFRRR